MPPKSKTPTPPVIPALKVGDILTRVSAANSIETAMVVAMEKQQTLERYALLSHRYGVLEVVNGQPIKNKHSWQTPAQFKARMDREARVQRIMDEANEQALEIPVE